MKFIRAALLASVITAVVGCGHTAAKPGRPPGESVLRGGGHYVRPARATDEYFKETSHLKLAPGWKWPKRPIQNTMPNGDRVMYEVGYGKQAADRFWFCSWSEAAATTTDGSSQMHRALAQLLKIQNLYYYTDALKGRSKSYFDRELNTAKQGNLFRLKRDVALNCPHR